MIPQTETVSADPMVRAPKVLPQIRVAVIEDLPDLLELCRDLFFENGISKVDWEIGGEGLKRAINGEGAVIGVIGPVGAIEAATHLQISNFWYSSEPHLEELFSYVRPKYRRSENAKALIDFGKRCAEGLGVPLLIGILSNHRTEEKIRLYRRRLGAPSGAFFLVGGKTGR